MRFRLSTLLLVMVVVGTSASMFGSPGLPYPEYPVEYPVVLAVYGPTFVVCVRLCVRGSGRLTVLAAIVALVAGFLVVVIPVLEVSRFGDDRRFACDSNLRQIGLALHLYCSAHGSYPPAHLANKDGTPMHSWRALILPYVESPYQSARYDFNEPWDGPNNQRLLSAPPYVFRCPSDPAAWSPGSPATSYVAVVGPGTFWGQPSSLDSERRERPRKRCIVVVEFPHSGIAWTEPKDLTQEEVLAGIGGKASPAICRGHYRGTNVLLADGTVEFVSNAVGPELFTSLVTEDVDDATLERVRWMRPERVAPRDFTARFLAWAGSVLLLLVHGVVYDLRQKRAAKAAAEQTAEAANRTTTSGD